MMRKIDERKCKRRPEDNDDNIDLVHLKIWLENMLEHLDRMEMNGTDIDIYFKAKSHIAEIKPDGLCRRWEATGEVSYNMCVTVYDYGEING